MANAHKGEVEFTADGKAYFLRFSTNAVCELEEVTGLGANAISRELGAWGPPVDGKGKPKAETAEQATARLDRVRVTLVRQVFWASLRDRHPDVTIKEAGDLMAEIGGMTEALELLNQAFVRAQPPETKGARPPKAA